MRADEIDLLGEYCCALQDEQGRAAEFGSIIEDQGDRCVKRSTMLGARRLMLDIGIGRNGVR
jgi:hypothetical protein